MKVAVCGQGVFLEKGLEVLKGAEFTKDPDTVKADLLVCLSYPKILKKHTIERFPKGCINFHPGLPRYRGRHPIQWMLIDGVKEIPCAVHYMDEGIDTGDIICESVVETGRNETYASALEKVASQVGPLVSEAVKLIKAGEAVRLWQDHGHYKRRRTEKDSEFSWDQESLVIHRFINAMSDPMPNAFCGEMKFKRSFIGEKPGRILDTTVGGRYVISTADGVVLVERA